MLPECRILQLQGHCPFEFGGKQNLLADRDRLLSAQVHKQSDSE
jgi:hypothetical protein